MGRARMHGSDEDNAFGFARADHGVFLGVLFLLFAPLPGHGGETVVDFVLNAIRAFGQNSSLLMSLP